MSVDVFHERSTRVLYAPTAVRFVGVVGADASVCDASHRNEPESSVCPDVVTN